MVRFDNMDDADDLTVDSEYDSDGASSAGEDRDQDESESSVFGNKLVHILSCRYCSRHLCKRAMRALLLADLKVELFSTDGTPKEGCALVNEPYLTGRCQCVISDVACLGCGNPVGYHIVQPCKQCLAACNNGHLWMFHGHSVSAVERPDKSRKCVPRHLTLRAQSPACPRTHLFLGYPPFCCGNVRNGHVHSPRALAPVVHL